MHHGLLDMLHDAADQHIFAIADVIHVYFDGVVEETVQQNRVNRWRPLLLYRRHVAAQFFFAVHHVHSGPPSGT